MHVFRGFRFSLQGVEAPCIRRDWKELSLVSDRPVIIPRQSRIERLDLFLIHSTSAVEVPYDLSRDFSPGF